MQLLDAVLCGWASNCGAKCLCWSRQAQLPMQQHHLSEGAEVDASLALVTTHRQILTFSRACLSRRELYDQTGSLQDSEELAGEQAEELYNYYRGIYKKVGCGAVHAQSDARA